MDKKEKKRRLTGLVSPSMTLPVLTTPLPSQTYNKTRIQEEWLVNNKWFDGNFQHKVSKTNWKQSENSITMATTGPEDMNLTNPGKKGKAFKSS